MKDLDLTMDPALSTGTFDTSTSNASTLDHIKHELSTSIDKIKAVAGLQLKEADDSTFSTTTTSSTRKHDANNKYESQDDTNNDNFLQQKMVTVNAKEKRKHSTLARESNNVDDKVDTTTNAPVKMAKTSSNQLFERIKRKAFNKLSQAKSSTKSIINTGKNEFKKPTVPLNHAIAKEGLVVVEPVPKQINDLEGKQVEATIQQNTGIHPVPKQRLPVTADSIMKKQVKPVLKPANDRKEKKVEATNQVKIRSPPMPTIFPMQSSTNAETNAAPIKSGLDKNKKTANEKRGGEDLPSVAQLPPVVAKARKSILEGRSSDEPTDMA